MKYKTKPCEIEAVQWEGHNLDEIIKFTNGLEKHIIRVEGLEPVIFISTLEGDMKASVGDYIIRGLRGEYYPCKPDVFQKKYEPLMTLREDLLYWCGDGKSASVIGNIHDMNDNPELLEVQE